MSNSRQPPSELRSYSITHPPGRVMVPTQPGWDYLVFTHAGLVTALTDTQAWTIPAHRALCVPSGTRVRIESSRRVAIRCLYFTSRLQVLDDSLRAVYLTPLARELVTHAVDRAPMTLVDPANEALVTLLKDQLTNEVDAPLHLPLPTDPVAKQLGASMMSAPAADLDQQLRAANASRRTIERRFKAETQMSLGQWRRRARILAAVSMLARGDTVEATSQAVGYSSASAFVSAFKAEMGAPPRVFMQSRR